VPGSAPALALSGFAAWLTGSGVVARVAIEQAAVCDPHHRMTQLIGEMLHGGLSPQVWLRCGQVPAVSGAPIWVSSAVMASGSRTVTRSVSRMCLVLVVMPRRRAVPVRAIAVPGWGR